jgi:hypothetical protein
MATVTSITAAIVAVLESLDWIDMASADEFVPSVMTTTCSAFVVPFDQETHVLPDVLDGNVITLTHWLTVEFWVQHKQGAAAVTMQVARDAGAKAIAALINNDGSGYDLARDYAFEERIDSAPVTHMGVPWVIVQLRVPVENEVLT